MDQWDGVDKIVAARYVSRFECIGSACEDNCCHGWNVAVDEPHYYQLRRRMSATHAERSAFRAAHVRSTDPERTASTFAYLRTDEKGCCQQLDAKGHCSTQSRYGAEALPDTCATYPRQINVVRRRVEVMATLSCPEIARLCLLAKDALDFDEIAPAQIPRAQIRRHLPVVGGEEYASYLDDIRVAFFQLLSVQRYPLSSRLFFLIQFAEETRPFFRRGAPVDENRLADALRAISRPQQLEALHTEFAALSCPPEIAASMIIPLLHARVTTAAVTPFHRLVAAAVNGAGADKGQTAEQAISAYERRRDFWEARFGERIERYFTNYAISYFLKEWYSGAADLVTYTLGFVVRAALIRFLLFSHPRMRALMEEPDTAKAEAGLDAAVVETVYSFTRVVEHDATFSKAIDDILASRELSTAAHAAFLAKF